MLLRPRVTPQRTKRHAVGLGCSPGWVKAAKPLLLANLKARVMIFVVPIKALRTKLNPAPAFAMISITSNSKLFRRHRSSLRHQSHVPASRLQDRAMGRSRAEANRCKFTSRVARTGATQVVLAKPFVLRQSLSGRQAKRGLFPGEQDRDYGPFSKSSRT